MRPSAPRLRKIHLFLTLLFLWLPAAALLAAGPAVTAPTPSPQAGFLGSTAQFSVTATGTGPFTYAWQHLDVGGSAYVTLSNGARIAGANAATLQISGLLSSDAGNYRCLVSNAGGQSNSGPGTLTVTAPPPPTVTHPANQTVTVGGTATFAVTASGTGPFTYAWQLSAGGGAFVSLTNGGRISGANGATLQITNVQTSDAGNYRCLVGNGGGQSNSGPGVLTVNLPPPPSVTAPSPASQTVTAGTSVSFSVTASGASPFTYTWQYASGTSLTALNDGDRGGRISGANTATLQIAATQTADAGSYRCQVTNAGGTAVSGFGTLSVNAVVQPPTVPAPAPASQTVQVGASATVSVTPSGTGPFSYAWQFNPGSGFVNVFNGDRGGRLTINGGVLALTNGQTSDTGSYRCLVSNAGGQTNSGPATITVTQGTPQLTVKDPQGHTVSANQISRMLIPYKSSCTPTKAIYTITNAGNAPLSVDPPTVTPPKQGTAIFSVALSSPTVPANGGTATLTVTFPCTVGFSDDFQRSGINLVSNAGNFSFDVSALWEMHFPEQGLQELATAIESMTPGGTTHALELTDWRGKLHSDPANPYGQPGASENLPVIAAAVALWAEPVSGGQDYRTWWATFLSEQLSPPGTAANDLAHYFQSSELMSFDYSPKVVAAIAGVHAWTYTNAPGAGAGGIRGAAVAYLRATVGAYALAAGQSWTRTAYGFSDGNAPDPNQIYSFVDGSDRPIVAGPYLALAGERSNSGYWSNDQRAHMFCHALGYSCTSAGRKSSEQEWQAAVVADAQAKLGSADLFGLTANERIDLTALVAESPGYSSATAASLLGGIRTLTTLHFLGWPGVRASCVEADTNTNTVPTLGAVYTLAPNLGTGKEAEFLYPFGSQRGRSDPGGGTCTVDLVNHVLRGALTITVTQPDGTTTTQLLQPVIQLPTGPPTFHYTLGPDGFH